MSRKWREARNEEGFTLIELLVVVIIIGILAAIAIPAFLNQRERAWVSAAQSDVRNAAIEVESYYAANMAYPGATGETAFADLVGDTIQPSANVTLTYALDTSEQWYTITACHSQVEETCTGADAGETAVYISNAGGLQ